MSNLVPSPALNRSRGPLQKRFVENESKATTMSLNLRKTSGNALSILSSDVMNRMTSFVLYAMVARHLGAQAFGQLTLAFTLFYTFQVFAVGGLKTLIVRQVAEDRSQTRLYFLNGMMIVTFLVGYSWAAQRPESATSNIANRRMVT